MEELAETLSRTKLQPRLEGRGYTVEYLMAVVAQLVEICSFVELDVPELRDSDDVVILGTALAATAEVIITGDRDLLALNEFRGIPILLPTDFLEIYFPDLKG